MRHARYDLLAQISNAGQSLYEGLGDAIDGFVQFSDSVLDGLEYQRNYELVGELFASQSFVGHLKLASIFVWTVGLGLLRNLHYFQDGEQA